MNFRTKLFLRLSTIFSLLIPITALAGIDQPWNDSNDGGGPITIGSTIAVIVYFYLLFKWPKHMLLLIGVVIAGGTVQQWFGDPFGWLAGFVLLIWGYKTFIHEESNPPKSP